VRTSLRKTEGGSLNTTVIGEDLGKGGNIEIFDSAGLVFREKGGEGRL